ncbi:head morphogenesis protein SPP1 gp7 [Sphingopyxis sp. FD7]|nr:head morphogenesis protein SPP1 gp7 [Sphingopyxis sp. FD7]
MTTRPDLRDTIYMDPGDIIAAWVERSNYRFSEHWTDTWQEEHAAAFTVAKIAKLDLLTAIHKSLDDVIQGGGTFEQWKANLLPELKKHGWWGVVQDEALTGTPDPVIVNERRLRTIYRTNIRMSMAAGRWRKYQREKELFPYLRYRSDHFRKHPRLDHKSWHGLILRVDDHAWQWMFPPNGWGCNCRVEQVSEARMRRMGWKLDEAPNPPRHDFITAAGEIVSVPQGVAPGFGYNPGTAHLRVLADRATASLKSALAAGNDQAAHHTLRQLIGDPAFEQFLAMPDGAFPVAILDPDHQATIAAASRIVMLPGKVYRKQLGEFPNISSGHPELTIADYRMLPDIVERAILVAMQGDNRLIYFADEAGRLWKAVVRQDAGVGFPAVVSFHRSRARNIAPETRNLEILLDRR